MGIGVESLGVVRWRPVFLTQVYPVIGPLFGNRREY